MQHWLTCSTCSNINTNLNHLKMLIFRWYYQQLCISMKLFNMFDNQYELQSFQSQVRRGDARHLSQHGSNIEKAFKINAKLNICKWIRVTRNQNNRPTFPQGGGGALHERGVKRQTSNMLKMLIFQWFYMHFRTLLLEQYAECL